MTDRVTGSVESIFPILFFALLYHFSFVYITVGTLVPYQFLCTICTRIRSLRARKANTRSMNSWFHMFGGARSFE